MATAGEKAAVRLHKWAGGFKKGVTVVGCIQDARRDSNGALDALVRGRLPPVVGFREAWLREGDPRVLWKGVNYFRSWGVKLDAHVATVMLASLTKQFEGQGDGTELSVTLAVRQLSALRSWMAADSVPLDSVFLTDLLNLFSAISHHGMSRPTATNHSLWCLTIAADLTGSLITDMHSMHITPPLAGLHSAAAVFLNARRFSEASSVIEELGIRGENATKLQVHLVTLSAKYNSPDFPQYVLRWGNRYSLEAVSVWYANGAGGPCPACGEPSNHTSQLPTSGWVGTPCARKSEMDTPYPPNYMALDRPDNANNLAAAKRILDAALQNNVNLRREAVLRLVKISAKAPPGEFDNFVKRLSDACTVAMADMFVGRLLHYQHHGRVPELTDCLRETIVGKHATSLKERTLLEDMISTLRGNQIRSSFLGMLKAGG